MKTSSLLALAASAGCALALLGAGCSTSSNANTPATPAPGNETGSSMASSTASGTSYTLADVEQHKDASSCWTVVRGNVYDVTAWINRHPGGQQAILSMCGKDATSAFTDQHDGQRRPENELASFQIGSLK